MVNVTFKHVFATALALELYGTFAPSVVASPTANDGLDRFATTNVAHPSRSSRLLERRGFGDDPIGEHQSLEFKEPPPPRTLSEPLAEQPAFPFTLTTSAEGSKLEQEGLKPPIFSFGKGLDVREEKDISQPFVFRGGQESAKHTQETDDYKSVASHFAESFEIKETSEVGRYDRYSILASTLDEEFPNPLIDEFTRQQEALKYPHTLATADEILALRSNYPEEGRLEQCGSLELTYPVSEGVFNELGRCASVESLTLKQGGSQKIRAVFPPTITEIKGDFTVESGKFAAIVLPSVKRIGGTFAVKADAYVNYVYLPKLERAGQINVIVNEPMHCNIKSLAEVDGPVKLVSKTKGPAHRWLFDSLAEVRGDFIIDGVEAITPSLQRIDGSLAVRRLPLDAPDANFGSLSGVRNIRIEDSKFLQSVQFPKVANLDGSVRISRNPKLEKVEFSQLEKVGGNFEITESNNLFPSKTGLLANKFEEIGGSLVLGLPKDINPCKSFALKNSAPNLKVGGEVKFLSPEKIDREAADVVFKKLGLDDERKTFDISVFEPAGSGKSGNDDSDVDSFGELTAAKSIAGSSTCDSALKHEKDKTKEPELVTESLAPVGNSAASTAIPTAVYAALAVGACTWIF